jgi:non-specific serine/threonine protein kinase
LNTGYDESQASQDASNLRSRLGDEAFAEAWAEGESMTFDEAVAYALALEPPASAHTQAPALTPREQEVARLIADGQTNRDIATQLTIAEQTAERHVANILNKLGFHSRAQVAAWYARQTSNTNAPL